MNSLCQSVTEVQSGTVSCDEDFMRAGAPRAVCNLGFIAYFDIINIMCKPLLGLVCANTGQRLCVFALSFKMLILELADFSRLQKFYLKINKLLEKQIRKVSAYFNH